MATSGFFDNFTYYISLIMIKLIGIPYDKNSSFLTGPAEAPDIIRRMESSGSSNLFSESLMEIKNNNSYRDLGNLDIKELSSQHAFNAIYNSISTEIEDGKILSLGGDHSISYPIIKAHARKYTELHVLQIDAHGDLYENFEGNPFSHASPFARLFEDLAITSLTQVGIRSLTTHLQDQVEKYNVRMIEMKHFNLSFINELNSPLYISVDLDGIDPAYAPGVSHHEPGGLSSRQVFEIIQKITVEIIGADIVELNPTRDHHDMTAMLAYKLMKELIAKML